MVLVYLKILYEVFCFFICICMKLLHLVSESGKTRKKKV